jgi:hypothetical protein
MPDTSIFVAPTQDSPKALQPDGYVVIASKLSTGSVKPPYKFTHWHEWRADLEDAGSFYADLERGEFEGWRPVAILPTFGGIPRREMALSPSAIAKLVKEAQIDISEWSAA